VGWATALSWAVVYLKVRTLLVVAYLIAGKPKVTLAELSPASAKAAPKLNDQVRFRPPPLLC